MQIRPGLLCMVCLLSANHTEGQGGRGAVAPAWKLLETLAPPLPILASKISIELGTSKLTFPAIRLALKTYPEGAEISSNVEIWL